MIPVNQDENIQPNQRPLTNRRSIFENLKLLDIDDPLHPNNAFKPFKQNSVQEQENRQIQQQLNRNHQPINKSRSFVSNNRSFSKFNQEQSLNRSLPYEPRRQVHQSRVVLNRQTVPNQPIQQQNNRLVQSAQINKNNSFGHHKQVNMGRQMVQSYDYARENHNFNRNQYRGVNQWQQYHPVNQHNNGRNTQQVQPNTPFIAYQRVPYQKAPVPHVVNNHQNRPNVMCVKMNQQPQRVYGYVTVCPNPLRRQF